MGMTDDPPGTGDRIVGTGDDRRGTGCGIRGTGLFARGTKLFARGTRIEFWCPWEGRIQSDISCYRGWRIGRERAQ